MFPVGSSSDADRFWSHVDKKDPCGCWTWTARHYDNGYAQCWWHGKTRKASRVAWAISNPDLAFILCSSNVHIRHSCNNRWCVNPSHLLPGTHRDNMADRKRSGNYQLVHEDRIACARHISENFPAWSMGRIANLIGASRKTLTDRGVIRWHAEKWRDFVQCALSMRADGASVSEIARRTGSSRQRVRDALNGKTKSYCTARG